jgi:hypothetical protein
MATKTFALRDRGTSRDTAKLAQSPVYFGLYDASPSRDWAQQGAKFKVFRPVRNTGPSRDTLRLGVRRGFSLHDRSPGHDIVILDRRPRVLKVFDLYDSSLSRDLVRLGVTVGLTIYDPSPSRDDSRFAVEIPAIASPNEGQEWGTVNLVENPSLEYDVADLWGWSASDATLTRTSAATAADGEYSGRLALAGGSVAPECRILSVRGMQETGFGRRWVGSAYLRGDVPALTLSLVLSYRDGTSDTSTPVIISDPLVDEDAVDRPLDDTWFRYQTEPVSSDGNKYLDHLELLIQPTSDPVAETLLRIDAVQIEEALSGGVTAYVDGDAGINASWVGAPGKSMSVRVTA